MAEGSDYTTTRQIKKDKKGNYFSYFKKEGSDDDYKEVISNKELYRYNGKYTQYFGLVGNDYEKECVKAIEDSIFQGDMKDQIQNEKERDSTITLQLTTKVQSGDDYDTEYGFSAGDTIEKTIIIDKKTQLITSVEEKCGDEVFYGYTVEFDGEEKIPQFYKDLKKEKEKRVLFTLIMMEKRIRNIHLIFQLIYTLLYLIMMDIRYMKMRMERRSLHIIRWKCRIQILIYPSI